MMGRSLVDMVVNTDTTDDSTLLQITNMYTYVVPSDVKLLQVLQSVATLW